MVTWADFIQQGIEYDKEAKAESRETELFLLKHKGENGIDPELIDEGIQLEKEYREILDNEIESQRNRLMEMK